jgi:hypothetical protein
MNKQGVCHIMALPFTLKSILRQKKKYEFLKISIILCIIQTLQKYNLQKNPLKETKMLQGIITL